MILQFPWIYLWSAITFNSSLPQRTSESMLYNCFCCMHYFVYVYINIYSRRTMRNKRGKYISHLPHLNQIFLPRCRTGRTTKRQSRRSHSLDHSPAAAHVMSVKKPRIWTGDKLLTVPDVFCQQPVSTQGAIFSHMYVHTCTYFHSFLWVTPWVTLPSMKHILGTSSILFFPPNEKINK